MTKPTVYCIDTSAILHAWNRRYPPQAFPTVWTNVEQLIAEGRLCATEEVQHELDEISDEVRAWARSHSGLFVPLDKAQTDEVTRILDQFEKLVDYRAQKSGADPFVIALAEVRGCTAITEERRTGARETPTIPNVCDALGTELCWPRSRSARRASASPRRWGMRLATALRDRHGWGKGAERLLGQHGPTTPGGSRAGASAGARPAAR